MKKISLSEHIKQSQIAVAANKIKGNRHGQILSMLYSDPYHFIEEIIQNAEDACRRTLDFQGKGKIRILINENAIDIYHNGSIFTEDDLMAISTFASTTKKGQPSINLIGKFGIGFRSVYGISESPEIHSGLYHYRIKDFEILESTESRSTHEFTTLIRLPYKAKLEHNIIKQINKELLELDHRLLLFLSHISEIEVHIGSKSLHIKREDKLLQKDVYDTVITINNERELSHRYLLFKRSTHLLKECSLAFEREVENGHFIDSKGRKVFVYFPTQSKIAHQFIIHGRYTTNPTREKIIFSKEHSPENYRLNDELSALILKALKWIRKEKILNSDFLKLFNWSHDASNPIDEAIQKSVDSFFSKEKCLISQSEKPSECRDLCLAEHKLIPEFIKKKDIFKIYSRFDFIHKTYLELPSFIEYLQKKHKVKIADVDSLSFYIKMHSDFLKKKNVSELITLYQLLENFPKLWDIKHKDRYFSLRFTPFILDTRKQIKAAFYKDGRAAIFLGKIKGKIPIVHPDIAENAEVRNFLSMLGIPESSPELADAEKILHNFSETRSNPHLYQIYNLFLYGDKTIKERIKSTLFNKKCIAAIHSTKGENNVLRPEDIYLSNDNLEKFFTYQPVYFVSKNVYRYFKTKNISEKELSSFLSELGVLSFPRALEAKTIIDENRKKELRLENDIYPVVKENISDFSLEGLDAFLNNPGFESSKALWELLCNCPDKLRQAEYVYESYIRSESAYFAPAFINILKDSSFLFDHELNRKKPKEISLTELHNEYKKNTPAIQWLSDILEIKKSRTDEFSTDEINLIQFIRNKSLSPEQLINNQLSQNKEEISYSFHEYSKNPIRIEQNTPTPIDHTTLMHSVAFLGTHDASESSLKNILDTPCEIIHKHLIENVFAYSKTIHVEKAGIGILKILDNNIFLTWIFIGVIDFRISGVLVNPKFSTLLQEKKDRKDINFYLCSGSNCTKVKGEDILSFIKEHSFITYSKLNLPE